MGSLDLMGCGVWVGFDYYWTARQIIRSVGVWRTGER
jgi:hypothetical protein